MSIDAIEAFLADSLDAKDTYRHLRFRNLRTFYYWIAERYNYPPARLKFHLIAPKVARQVRASLSAEQAAQFLQLEMPPRDRAIIRLLLEAGPRAGEICALRAEDIQDGVILVRGKTGERVLQVSSELTTQLKALAPSGPIFLGTRGKRLTVNTLYKAISTCFAQIGITDSKRGCHRLRHAYGRLHLEFGGDIESLRQQLGHTKITTTAIYAESASGQMRKRAIAAQPYSHIKQLAEVKDGPGKGSASD